MKAIWAKGLSERINTTLAFRLDLGKSADIRLELAAASCYKIYSDGKFFAFGPQRAAHGYARLMKYSANCKTIVVIVYSPYINGFCWLKQKPFFACRLFANGKEYSAEDFTCYFLDDRIQKVQRYSYQRSFVENYRVKNDLKDLCTGNCDYPVSETEAAALPTLLPAYVDEPLYGIHFPQRVADRGFVEKDDTVPVWRDGMIHDRVGKNLDGYRPEEWEDSAPDQAVKFVYRSSENVSGKELLYEIYDLGKNLTGFAELTVKAQSQGTVFLIFDEVLSKKDGEEKPYVRFNRQGWTNVHKWRITRAGEYELSSFEPYTGRHYLVVRTAGITVDLKIRDYENPNGNAEDFACSSEQVKKVVGAAMATLKQNSTDILFDCPSRERAGWLCDSYFTSEAEFIATGKNQAEKTFLENYALADCSSFPKGMIPMCYPSDNYDTFLPNWSLFYILELEKYAKRYGKDDGIVRLSLDKVRGLTEYFEKFENETGLLENLEGWVFVEWSRAVEKERLRGVHIPTNICYARALKAAANLLGDNALNVRAERVENAVKRYAFNGEFFVDNLIRDENGALKQSGLLSEICQYYAFWFGLADRKSYGALYRELTEKLGVRREKGYRTDVAESNVFTGLYMRVDLLMREGKKREVLDECVKLFLPMAEKTGTLWELDSPDASCDHGFASYALVWLKFAINN